MRIEIAWVGPMQEALVEVDLAPDATVEDAVARAAPGLLAAIRSGALHCAIYGRRVELSTRLADDDRVEITRPLVCDPKLARRRRAARGR
jgi:putative ubiquitin-RnfH superfamily antitoxin RatB of RatAB toxin-antitoxin module